jgi:hypothetical protein
MEAMMTRKTTTPKEITEILTLREAGYTVLAISQKLNISTRTIDRHLATHGAKKGSLKQEVIENARTELFKLITSNTAIREEAAKLIADDIAHSKHIRAIVIEASEFLKATSLPDAVLVMRGAAAYATVFKATSDTIRHALGVDRLIDESDELPELMVSEMTAKDVEKMREQQDKDYRKGEGYSEANEDEDYSEGEELDIVEES